jgi:hypothetical protein
MTYIFLYAFIGCWVPQLIQWFSHCEQICTKHGCTGFYFLHILIYTPLHICQCCVLDFNDADVSLMFSEWLWMAGQLWHLTEKNWINSSSLELTLSLVVFPPETASFLQVDKIPVITKAFLMFS